jgi:hypothetical protein
MEQFERATLTMREEAAKAQALALWVEPKGAKQALADAEALAFRTPRTRRDET